MSAISFRIDKRLPGRLGRAGVIKTPHGHIETPAFVVVGTKATVKALTPEQLLADVGAQAVLANTYHLYLEPGEEILKEAGGLHGFMNWQGPSFTDSGGFQVFSLGAGLGRGLSKFGPTNAAAIEDVRTETRETMVKIDEDGVSFQSYIDGSSHRFTPERSMEIQHAIGADIMFAFDECPSPTTTKEYQREAMERTHRWAERSLLHHKAQGGDAAQGLFGIVQGGAFEDLRKESAQTLAKMDFAGFGIGGSYTKEDFKEILPAVNSILPEEKPRHLLGIGEPADLFVGIEHGIDTFDCVAPTRIARNGMLYTKDGLINILNSKYRTDFSLIDPDTPSYTSNHYTRAYLAHLFRSKEMLGATLASIHNLYFIVTLVKDIRQSILDDRFDRFREEFLGRYLG
ncbi:MAG: tRNA guanosine(34) transglycosylase Tgt [Candidatus Pacebacteria bacterium]|nr:tRNA guanosine(34) transglycosylase Tgt [Candidatus Paceibacterota bacterium]